jgi:hypothetical protein
MPRQPFEPFAMGFKTPAGRAWTMAAQTTRQILHADDDLEAFIAAAARHEPDPEPVVLEM